MNRIGLFGGSFNPPHRGHLNTVIKAKEQIGLSEVWMLVTPQNPHKDPALYAPISHRMSMVELLSVNEEWLKPTDIEKNFDSTNTADTLMNLSALYPNTQFTWIMGSDNFITFHNWNRLKYKVSNKIVPDWQYILANFPIAVMDRNEQRHDVLNSKAAQFAYASMVSDPKKLGENKNGWAFIDNPGANISSTQILIDLKKGIIDYTMLTVEVAQYLYEHALYPTPKTMGVAYHAK